MIVVSSILMVAGLLFVGVSTIGLLTLPELYTRAHAVAKSETLGLLLIFGGLMLRPESDVGVVARLAFVLVFALIANPTAVHALVRAARVAGVEPWQHEHDAPRHEAEAPPDGEDGA